MTAWANFTVTGGGGCNCCGGGAPACFLNLPPVLGTPGYASLAAAENQITNYSDNCLVWTPMGTGGFLTSLSAHSPAGNTLFVNYDGLYQTALPDEGRAFVACSVGANTYLNYAFVDNADSYVAGFSYSNGDTAGELTGASNSILIVPADNITVSFQATQAFGSGSITMDINLFSPNAVSFCSIRANYDSGGGVYAWLNC